MRGCKAVDVNGNVVMRFASLTDAAYYYGVSIYSLRSGIVRKMMRKGNYVVYDDDPITNVKTVSNSGRESLELDNLTSTQFEKEGKRLLVLGIKPEILTYELKFGRMNITPCRKKESSGIENTKIGGVGCITCRYFRGRCREERKVLCVQRHATTGGHYGCKGKHGK